MQKTQAKGGERRTARLTAKTVESLRMPGRYADGGGLWLQVRAPDAGARAGAEPTRSWLLRYTRQGRQRQLGLGGYPEVGLADARVRAAEARRLLAAGVDPIAHKHQKIAETARAQRTFAEAAASFIAAHEAGWRNPKHAAQWRSTLDTYAMPHLGRMPVADVATEHVLAVLQPIWAEKPETASRVRGRLEAVLAAEAAAGRRERENPAAWRNHLDKLLPRRSKVQAVEHHPAVPWSELPAFMLRLQAADGLGARALELAILAAARSGEVLGAAWGEFDLAEAVWTVPGSRMKAGRPHRVPLSEPALVLLRRLETIREHAGADAYLFPGQRRGSCLSNMAPTMALRRLGRDDVTVHGFRSTFRDWAADHGKPGDVAEAALAHVIGDKTEAAYRRGDLFQRRRELMAAWGDFCTRPADAVVLPFRAPAA